MKYLITILTLSLVFSCANSSKESNSKLNELVADYEVSAKKLLTHNKKKASNKVMVKSANELIAKAKPILVEFKKKNPQCEELLTIIMNSDTKMGKLTLEEIEEQYHEGSVLPESDDLCFEAKELIVHPATVIVISNNYKLKKVQRNQINDEIAEVLGHLGLFKENI